MHEISNLTEVSEPYHPQGIFCDAHIIEMSICARGIGAQTANLSRASQEQSQGFSR